MAIGASFQISPFDTKPSAPPTGFYLVYIKTDNTFYIQDSSGNEYAFGSTSFISQLTGEATAIGPGAAAVTLSNSAVIGKVLTGFTPGPNSPVAATDTILQAFEKLQAQTSSVSGSALTALTGDVSATGPGSAAATVNSVGGQSASNINASVTATQNATASNTASTLVERDASGNFSANIITSGLTGNVTGNLTGNVTGNVSGSSSSFTGSLSGDVTGTQSSTVVSTIGGKTASDVATATGIVDAATSVNTASTLVKRDASGNFAANVITASLTGNVTGNISGSSSSFTGNLSGDITGTQSSTVVATVGGKTASDIASATAIVDNATSANTPSTLVERDSSGNISVSTATVTNLTDSTLNANTVVYADGTKTLQSSTTTATELSYVHGVTSSIQTQLNSISGSAITALTGDVSATGPGSVSSTVNSVGGSSAANIHSAELVTNAATNNNTASTIVKRDASGNFSANIITASLTGNVTGNVSGSSASFTGSLAGDVTGTQSSTTVDAIQGTQVSSAAPTDAQFLIYSNTASKYVPESLSGDASLTRSGSLTVNSVGGSSSSNIHSAELAANAATNLNTASTIVKRDSSGNFSAGVITANLTGNVSGSSSSFTGSLSGDVTGTQSATVVGAIQGNQVSTTTPTDAQLLIYSTSANKWQPESISGDISLTDTGTTSIASTTVTGKLLTGYTVGSSTPIAATDSIISAFEKVQGQLNATSSAAITALSGDVVATGPGSVTATIQSNVVTNAKLAQAATLTLKGNNTGSTANVSDLTVSQVSSMLNNATPPVQIGTSNNTGSSSYVALADHVHSHGNQTSPTLHALATDTTHGFLSSTDKTTIDGATSTNTVSTLVERDSSGNFSAGTITASLAGNVTGNLVGNVTGNVSGSSSSFTGSLSGDVTGTQSSTVVSTVGGKTASDVASATATVDAATNLNTLSTLVKRDGTTGGFNAGSIVSTSLEVNGTAGAGYVQYDIQTSAPSAPSAGERLFSNLSNGITRYRAIDSGGTTLTQNRDAFFICYNSTGSTITPGQAVYVNGIFAGTPNVASVALAQANSTLTAPVIGLSLDTIANNSYGRILFTGQLNNLNLNAYSNGQALYLSPTTAGSFTSTEPTAPNISQLIGYVINNSATVGVLDLSIRSALNTASGTYRSTFQVGPASGSSPVNLEWANANTGILAWNPSANVTLTLPAAQGTNGSYLANDGSGNLSWSNPVTNIDGGNASSVFTSTQIISGGTA